MLVPGSPAAAAGIGKIANRDSGFLQLFYFIVQFLTIGAGGIGEYVKRRPGLAPGGEYDQVGIIEPG